ncbi:MAG TPA: radical SAM/SPASM domain-containing protein [bacterium]|nr:radical SAM/SPASM domain-containing protein [bacterium]
MEYGFYDRLKAEFPSQVIVDVTEVCNLACIHCPHPEFKKSEYYAGRYLDPELNSKVVEEVRNHGQGSTQYIRYTSEGEPLVHPKCYDMLDDAVKNSGVLVTLTTNGTIMNEKRTRQLLEAGVHMIDISIDAFTPETYARVRVNGNLDVTRANVLNLIGWTQSSRSKTKVVVSYVEQPENRHETKDFEAFWKDHGASYVVVRSLHSAAGAVASIAERMRLENEKETRHPCVYPWERIMLNPRGQLAFCPADWTHGSSFVDYKTTTIRETWDGDFYRRLREAHLQNRFANHGFCGQCPDWKSTPWPGGGRSYADMVEGLKKDF